MAVQTTNLKRKAAGLCLLATLLTACSGESRNGTMADIDGNTYRTVTIGGTTWMAENLRVTHYRNGDPIPEIRDSSAWSSATTGAWCSYDGKQENTNAYGRIYNWHAVNDPRGLAPKGWHVATAKEWEELVTARGGEQTAGTALKASGKWGAHETAGTEASGFDALPAGARRDTDGAYVLLGQFARFWTATASDAARAFGTALEYYDGAVRKGEVRKANGFSVRCVRD